ncbi:MAG: hypothetical protein WC797_03020 [Candidatus Paceibacterota bacterium]|jgi:cytochrome c biogenesis protein CcdA
MKKITTILVITVAVIVGIVVLRQNSGTASLVWALSDKGTWLLPLVLVAAVLDSVHPCSFSILLLTVAFLFSVQVSRKKIIQMGGAYIAGIFSAYLLIGLGILRVLHLFNTPHFMGKLGATLLIAFGMINILNELFPGFPIKLKIPTISHTAIGRLMAKASLPAVFGLGLLVGICQFPCMGGPYLMVIGLLRDQVTYFSGFGYLFLYNTILIVPLVFVLWIAANNVVLEKIQEWKKTNMTKLRFWAGFAMLALGILVFFI